MIRKFECSCGALWFSDEVNPVCEDSDDEYTGQHNHTVKLSKKISSQDYAELWSQDLESANRHDTTELPNQILGILEKHISNKKVIRWIMKDMYDRGLGV